MRCSAYLLLWLTPCLAQDAAFAPLPPAFDLGPLQRYTVTVRNPTAAPITVTAAWVFAVAMTENISPATHSAIQQAVEGERSPAWHRRLALGIELAAYAATALMASGAIEINERAKALIPATGAVLRGFQIAADRARPSVEIPDDLLPAVFQISANGMVAYSMYGAPTRVGLRKR